jgi:hypothetical protein
MKKVLTTTAVLRNFTFVDVSTPIKASVDLEHGLHEQLFGSE